MARYTLTLLALCALCLALADARNYKGTSREQELIQQQIEAQERNNQKGLEAQGIADEWKSEGRGYGRRHNDNDGGRYGGRKHRYDDDASDWQEEKHYGKRERKYGRKHRHHHDEEESYGGKKQRGYGRKHRKGGRADIGDSTGDWGAEDRAGRGGSGVPATYHYYSPAYETSSLYCADAFRNKAGRELLKRPWMAYCAKGGMSQDKCGRCARVTNLRTGASVVMLIVDMCGTGGVDMDPIGFNQIDTDGAGVRDGRMEVSVNFCGC